ncbi:MAG: gliding motility protein GldN [Bacteroidales bacterium]|nr:gliding motility protein GldN [Bacteroidales bacterium]MBN2817657.1 gliding motility protein GldN [Bacteroidales bacterium]
MKRIGAVIGLIAISLGLFAQDNLLEVYAREHIPNKTPVPYEYMREADVMWSKVVYRMIDLRQKQNLPLYYPTKPIGGRMSFVSLILYGIDNEGVRAFSSTDQLNEFTAQMTLDEINSAFDAGVDTIITTDPLSGELIPQIIDRDRKTDEVQKILVKEKWFFDKNHSVMKVRIIGICPIRTFFRTDDQGMPTEDFQMKQTMWVYFPEIRPLLANHEIYNEFNDSQRISFDDFFMQRRFTSNIFAVSNVYDNRRINSYSLGVDALLESEKLKEWLFNIEHDLWEY